MSPGLRAQLLRRFKRLGYLYPQRKLQFLVVHCFWWDDTIIAGLGDILFLQYELPHFYLALEIVML